MNRIVKIFATGFLSVLALTASAQNGEGDTKESLFNPVNYAVISQTIAPDARGSRRVIFFLLGIVLIVTSIMSWVL